jgi:hypothetical protein
MKNNYYSDDLLDQLDSFSATKLFAISKPNEKEQNCNNPLIFDLLD